MYAKPLLMLLISWGLTSGDMPRGTARRGIQGGMPPWSQGAGSCPAREREAGSEANVGRGKREAGSPSKVAGGVLYSKNPDGLENDKPMEGVRVLFRLIGGLIIVPVRINGSRPLNMILDTGMSARIVFLFHSELGQEIGLKYAQEVELGGAEGEQGRPKASLAVGAQVEISGLVQTNQQIVVMNEPRETSHWTFDGIIGKSILDSYAVEIDYQRSFLIIHDPFLFKPEDSAPAIPIALKNGLPVIDASLDTEEEKGIPIKLIVDLGNRNSLVFNVNPKKKIHFPKRTLSTVIGRGVQEELPGESGVF